MATLPKYFNYLSVNPKLQIVRFMLIVLFLRKPIKVYIKRPTNILSVTLLLMMFPSDLFVNIPRGDLCNR